MGVSSADPDHLDTYVAAASDLNQALRRRMGSLVEAYDRVVPGLRWGVFDAAGAVGGLATYVALNEADDEWVATIAGRFRAADGDGEVALADEALEAALRAAGVGLGPRAGLTVDDPVVAGAPPTSGYASDPVCTATGHFVEREIDLSVPRRVVVAGWARTYTSRWLVSGPFGRGWASWASVRAVPVGAAGVVVVLPDGRQAPFAADGSGGYRRVTGLPADLVAGSGGWELRWFDQDRWSFDSDGRLAGVGSPARGDPSFLGSSERLERIEHSGGHAVDLVWSGSRVVSVRASDGRSVEYRYDDAGDLVSVEGPGFGRRRYEVRDGLVEAVVDGDGVVLVRNTYDPDGRVRSQTSPFGGRIRFRYPGGGVTVVSADGGTTVTHLHDPVGRLVGVVDHAGARMTKFYDEWGNPAATSDRTGAVVSQLWDERGRLLQRTGPDGATTRFEWDDLDRVVVRVDPTGAEVRLTYRGDDREPSRVVDGLGAVTRATVVGGQIADVTDADGVTSRFERDGDGLVVAAVDALGGRTSFTYDAAGGLVSVVSPAGDAVRLELDGGQRVVRRTDGDGTSVGYEWSAAGRLVASVTATGARSSFRYGDHGEVVAVVDSGGETSTLEWDALGHLVGLTNPLGTTVRHRYDGSGRLVSTIDGCGAELRREHDAEGRVVALVDGAGGVVRRTYDACGRLTTEVGRDGGSTAFGHDPCGRLVSVTDPSGATTTHSFDAAGRVVAVTDPAGTTRYRWTRAGRLREVVLPDGAVVRHRYDPAGRLVAVAGPGEQRRRYEHDAAGRVVAVTTETGARTEVELDGCGRRRALRDAAGDVTRWVRHPSGRVASVEAPGGGATRFGWDSAGRLASAVDANGAETTYHWNADGSLAGATDALGGSQVHTNDAMGRLVAWTDQLGHRTDVRLDGAGRVVGHRDPSGVEVSHTATTVPGARIDAGDRSTYSEPVVAEEGPAVGATCEYDPAGQLIGRRSEDGRTWSWSYDACGRRVEHRSPEGVDRYRHDAAGRLLEVVRHGPRSAVTQYRYDAVGRRTYEIHGELGRLWSIRYRWDELGQLQEVRRREGSGPDRVVPVEGDLVRLGFRVLDRSTGSFLSPDPLPGVPGTPVVANPYHYAANDPVRMRDPFGLRPMTDADLEAIREAANRPVWQKATDSAADLVDDPVAWAADHWETVAAAGLVVVGGVLVATGVGAPIGAGILVGASMAFASQVALTGEVDQRSLLVSTAAGAVGGGVGGATSGLAVTSQVAIGAGTDMALSAGAQYATTGTVDPQQVLLDGTIGAATTGVGVRVGRIGQVELDPRLVRFSQSSVNDVQVLIDSMGRKGWRGAPIDVIEMVDGNLTTIDNSRVLAAGRADIEVRARVHGFDDGVPRWTSRQLTRRLGEQPGTWGDAASFRIRSQKASFRRVHPDGSHITTWKGG